MLERDNIEATAVIGRSAPWANRDFICTLMQVALFHSQGESEAWRRALMRTEALAGGRDIPPA